MLRQDTLARKFFGIPHLRVVLNRLVGIKVNLQLGRISRFNRLIGKRAQLMAPPPTPPNILTADVCVPGRWRPHGGAPLEPTHHLWLTYSFPDHSKQARENISPIVVAAFFFLNEYRLGQFAFVSKTPCSISFADIVIEKFAKTKKESPLDIRYRNILFPPYAIRSAARTHT